jgi:two-component system sensor histidine kinase UhpB
VQLRRGFKHWRLSLFEKVILVNSGMLIGEALAGLWVTSHNLEVHHYLIDTGFIVLAMLLTLTANVFLLRASFRPLFSLLATMRTIGEGKTSVRATVRESSDEIGELARTFNTMLDRLEAARREQTHLILQAQEDERRRISLELHDEAGQNLTALLIHEEVLNQTLQELMSTTRDISRYQQVDEELRQLIALTQHTLENIRVLAQQLRPSVLDDLGLLAAFRWLVEDSQQRLNLMVSLTLDEQEALFRQLPPAYETALFRVAQESLTNIARHARAGQATITLRRQQEKISLTIRDNGRGYVAATFHPGTGILGMRERATMLGGSLKITSLPEKGTIVRATLPCPPLPQATKPVEQAQTPASIQEVAIHGR